MTAKQIERKLTALEITLETADPARDDFLELCERYDELSELLAATVAS